MDFGKLQNMASEAMKGGKKEGNSEGGESKGQGGFDISNLASMAGGMLGGDKKSGDSQEDMISNAMKMVSSMGGSPPHTSEIKEAHDQAYNKNSLTEMSQKAMGMAAAYEIFGKLGGSGSSGGNMNSIIGKVIAEAMKLLSKSGGSQSGGNEQLTMSAVQTAMKLFAK